MCSQACTAASDGGGETTASTSSAVIGGVTDHTGIHKYVGQYGFATGSCSGTLITPVWVLTARHCIYGDDKDERLSDTRVSFGYNGIGADYAPDYEAWHTLDTSGEIWIREAAANDILDDDSVSKDLALILLDKRIATAKVAPLHVPSIGTDTSPTCHSRFGGNTFGATLVGFGGADSRNYRWSDGWKLETQSPGNLYQNAWFGAEYALGSSDGASEPGDSGGALIADSTLCGVTSGHVTGVLWHGLCPLCYPEPVVYTMTVALDGSDSISHITANIVDSEGRLMGECKPGETHPVHPDLTADSDFDQDLIPDACDACWHTADPDYRKTKNQKRVGYPRTGEQAGAGCCPLSYFSIPGGDPDRDQMDSDGDGVPDLCDSCPFKSNPEQLDGVESDVDSDMVPDKCDTCPSVATVVAGVDQRLMPLLERTYDQDSDGVGDVCDWCNGHQPSDQVGLAGQVLANCNLEAELVLNYPGLADPPIIRADSTSYSADLAKYQATFKIGSCETAPCPSMYRDESSGGFPPGQEPTFQCIAPEDGHCYFANQNIVMHKPVPAGGAPATQNGLATTHVKWCDCGDLDVETRAGRESCSQHFGCSRKPQQFGTLAAWREIRLAKYQDMGSGVWGFDWANAGPPAKYVLPFSGKVELRTMWDYRALGTPFVKNKDTGLPYVEGVDGALSASVNGMLWNSTRGGFGYAPSSAEESALHDRASCFESGAARVSTRGNMHTPTQVPTWDLDMDMPCYTCGKLGIADLVLAGPLGVEDPGWLVGETGARPAPGLLSAGARSALLDAVASGSAIVQAAEPIGVVEMQLPQVRSIRVALVNPASPTQVTTLETTSLSGIVDTGCGLDPTHCDRPMKASTMPASTEPAGPGPLTPDEGWVLSSSKQQILRFGGLVQAAPRDAAWIYDLQTRAWTRHPLALDHRPGAVVAGTFRIKDGRLYEIDRGPNGSFATLRAWVPGDGSFEEIGRLPPPWKAFSRYWLITNERGDLFLVATRKSRSAIARFSFTAGGALEFKGLWVANDMIVARPFANDSHVGITVADTGGTLVGPAVRQRSIEIGLLKDKPNGWVPSRGK